MKIGRILAVAAIVACTFVGAAQAQVSNMMFPPFNPGQTVYVSREMNGAYAVDVNGLANDLNRTVSGLHSNQGRSAHVYEVFVKEPVGGVQTAVPGGAVAQTIFNKWSQNGLPDDSILIVLARRDSNPNAWLVGVRLGPAYQRAVDLPTLGGLINKDMNILRSGDYKGYSVALAGDVANQIGLSFAQRPITQPPVVFVPSPVPVHQTPWALILGGIAVAVIGGFVAIRRYREGEALRRRLAAVRQEVAPVLANLAGCIGKIKSNYGGLANGDKQFAPGSRSAAAYAVAMKELGQLWAGVSALTRRDEQIAALAASYAPIFRLKGMRDAVALATTSVITVSETDLPAEATTLRNGGVERIEKAYVELAHEMERQYQEANETFASIWNAVSATQANKTAIEADVARTLAAKQAMEQKGVVIDHVQEEIATVTQRANGLIAEIAVDPLGALDDSNALKAEIAAVHAKIDEFMQLDTNIAALRTEFVNDPAIETIAKLYSDRHFVEAAAGVKVFKKISALRQTQVAVAGEVTAINRCVTQATIAKQAAAQRALAAVVAQSHAAGANFAAVDGAANGVVAAFADVRNSIQSDSAIFRSTEKAVNDCVTAFNQACAVLANARVTDALRQQLEPIRSNVGQLQNQVQTGANQDWTVIHRRADAAAAMVAALNDQAQKQIAESEAAEKKMNELNAAYARYNGGNYYGRTLRGRYYGPTTTFVGCPYGVAASQHQMQCQLYWQNCQYDLLMTEMMLYEQQLILANNFMWYSTWDAMYLSGDPWAMRYAYDAGFQQGMAFDAYNDQVVANYAGDAGGEAWTYTPPAESSWSPSTDSGSVANCGGGSTSDSGGGSTSDSGGGSTSNCSGGSTSNCSSSGGSSCGGGGGSSCGGGSS